MNGKIDNDKSFWSERTKLEKVCVIILIISAGIFITEFLEPFYTYDTSSEVCDSPECIQAASELIKFIDPSIDPCDDFYNFACGTFAKNAFINEAPSPIKVLRKRVNKQLAEIIMESIKEDDEISLKVIKKLYQACMDTEAIEKDNGRALLLLIEQLGGWPVIEQSSWNENQFDWFTFESKVRQTGLYHHIFFSISHYSEWEWDNGSIAEIRSPHLNQLKSELKDDYVNYMADIAVLLGASRFHAFNDMRKVMHFEDQLKKAVEIGAKSTEDEENTSQSITIDELQNRLPAIAWIEYLNNITYPSYTFKSDDMVMMFAEDEYVKQLLLLLARTPKRTQANYCIWKSIQPYLKYLKQDVLDRSLKFNLLTRPARESDKLDRHEYCAKNSRFAVEAAYARKYMTQSKINDISEIIENIVNEYEIALNMAEWLDEESKLYALEKLRAMNKFVGCPKDILNGSKIDEKFGYHKIPLNTSNVIEILSNISVQYYDTYYSQLYDNSTNFLSLIWDLILSINAYHARDKNLIILPAATLQGMFYNQNLPKYYNYGALGGIIGHEISHGFSKGASIYGTRGKKEQWWTNATTEAYEAKVQCLIDEYGNFSTAEVDFQLNGTITLEENFADFVGVKIAYRAYRKSLKAEEKTLPGLQLTGNQLFWIMTSSYECFKGGSHMKTPFKEYDVHSLPSFRVMAPLRNTYYFAEDFNCPLGSFMNPIEKCEVL